MKRALLLVSLVVAATTCGARSTADARTTTTTSPPTTTLVAPTADRSYEVHVPPSYSASVAAPLLLILHGYRASGAIESFYLKLTSATDAAGMLTVAPDGTLNARGNRFWNATDACCAARGATVDDAGYLMAIVHEVEATYNVDRKRIFIVGHSNGGFMAYRMACDHADTFAAVASLAGATFADPRRCAPSAPVATLQIHGTDDDTIAYDGGKILGRSYPSALTTTKRWARYDGCKLVPDSPPPAPHDIVLGLPPATVTAYTTGCKANGAAELWTQQDGTHIPLLSPTFGEQVVAYLMAHPKP